MPLDLSQVDFNALRGTAPEKKRNALVAGVSAGTDNLQELGYSALAAGADALGLQRGKDWLLDRAYLNRAEARENGRPDLESVEDQDFGSALPYLGYQISKQAPQIAAALGIGALTGGTGVVPAALSRGAASLPTVVGGGGLRAGMDFAARRAAMEAGQKFAGNLVGGMGMGSAMGAGSMYGESVDAGNPNALGALLASPIYGVTEGIPTALLGGTIAKGAFRGGLPMRMAKAGGVNALGGATSELAQNEMEMAFNPTLSEEEIFSRRLNSAVAGGLAEGAIGSAAGLRRPSLPAAPKHLLGVSSETQEAYPEIAGQQDAQPMLSQNATLGQQGALFEGQGASQMQQIAPQAESYDAILSDIIQLQQMANEAQANGDTAQLEVVNGALRQLSSQLTATGENSTTPRDQLFSGVYETVGDRPYELTGQEVAAGGLPSLEGEMTPVPQDSRLSEVRAALTQANGGKSNAQLTRFVPEFRNALAQGPDAVAAVLAKYDTAKSLLKPEVLETADQLAQTYFKQDINGLARQGEARAQPGVVVNQTPTETNTTEMQMRQRNAEQQAVAVADTDTKVASAQQQPDVVRRSEVLNTVLTGATNPGNARNRFIRALRKTGIRDTMVTPDEQAAIQKFFDVKALDTVEPKQGDVLSEKIAPRKAKFKTKVDGQEVEVEVPDADKSIKSLQYDIDKYKAFIKCLAS